MLNEKKKIGYTGLKEPKWFESLTHTGKEMSKPIAIIAVEVVCFSGLAIMISAIK
ncbi:MAG: hypothetical protein QXP36_10550 [Conexivisphaerales archaeon]